MYTLLGIDFGVWCELFHIWVTMLFIEKSLLPSCSVVPPLFHTYSDPQVYLSLYWYHIVLFSVTLCGDFGYSILNRSSFPYIVTFKISWLLALYHFHTHFRMNLYIFTTKFWLNCFRIAFDLLNTIHSFSFLPPLFFSSLSPLFLWFSLISLDNVL